MTLATRGVLRLAWKGMLNSSPKGVISILHAHCIIEKRCLSYLAYVYDTSIVSSSPIDYIWVVHEFMVVFPTDSPSVPPNLVVSFSIDMESVTKPIFIPLGLTELKELKEQL